MYLADKREVCDRQVDIMNGDHIVRECNQDRVLRNNSQLHYRLLAEVLIRPDKISTIKSKQFIVKQRNKILFGKKIPRQVLPSEELCKVSFFDPLKCDVRIPHNHN